MSTLGSLDIFDAANETESTTIPINVLNKMRGKGGILGNDGANIMTRLYYECLHTGRSKLNNESIGQEGELSSI